MSRLLRSALALVFSMAVGVGCGQEPETKAQCTESSECSNGRSCTFTYCVDPSDALVPLDVELIPPSGESLVRQHLAGLQLTSGATFDITMVPSAIITGDVLRASNLQRVNGTLTAQTPGEIEGVSHQFIGKSSGDGFQIAVLPDREYRVTFRPDNNSIPPHSFVWSSDITAAGSTNAPQDVVLPDADYVRLAGQLVWGDGQGPENATVTAYAMDGVRLTRTQTESWRGDFWMDLPPGTQQVTLRVKASSDGPQFPAFTVTEAVEQTVKIPILKTPRDRETLDVAVLGPIVDAEGEELGPVAQASLSFTLDDTDGLEVVTAETDGSGIASVQLIPGSYTVKVAPAAGSPYPTHLWQEVVVIESDNGEPQTASVTLGLRPVVRGAVLDDRGNLVEGKVTARRRSDDGLLVGPSSFEAETDDGVYELAVDPGSYDLHFTPDPETQAPPSWKLGVQVAADVDQLDFRLPAPGVVALRVLDVEGNPVPDVQVRAFMPMTPGDGQGLREFSDGLTNPKGWVSLPVPQP